MNKDLKKRNHQPSSLHDKQMNDLSAGSGERTGAKRPNECEPMKLVDLLVLHGFKIADPDDSIYTGEYPEINIPSRKRKRRDASDTNLFQKTVSRPTLKVQTESALNVKIGDLAIVVNDGGKHENVGLVVTVVSFEGKKYWHEFGERPSWMVEAAGPRGICYEGSDGELYFKREGKMPDCCLKRIEPDLNEDDLSHEETLNDTLPARLALSPECV
jgi:hypothetical protein